MTHTLFVDDVLLFLGDSKEKYLAVKEIIECLSRATSMVINLKKSAYYTQGIDEIQVNRFQQTGLWIIMIFLWASSILVFY